MTKQSKSIKRRYIVVLATGEEIMFSSRAGARELSNQNAAKYIQVQEKEPGKEWTDTTRIETKTGEVIEPEPTNAVVLADPIQPAEPDSNQAQGSSSMVEFDNGGRESALSIVGGVTTEQLKQALVVQTEQRKLIQEFIQENLVEGVDYGKIHVVKNCMAEEKQRGSCTKDYHFSKSILFKPGQEKIFSLFGITDELEKDDKAYEMLGNVPGMVAFKCVMYRGKNRVGEGRGAATMSGSQNDPNSTIKKAEKRARMDACLSLGFSAYFTQDLDDPEYKAQREMMNEKARNEAEARDRDENGLLPRDPAANIDDDERKLLHRLITAAGFTDKNQILELLRANGIVNPAAMTSGEARKMIIKLKATDFMAPEPTAPTEPLVVPPAPFKPAELVVDDELKAYVTENYEQIGLNSRGNMWFMKEVTGRPFGKFEQFSEEQWRRAYQFMSDILDIRIEVDPGHMRTQDITDQTKIDFTNDAPIHNPFDDDLTNEEV